MTEITVKLNLAKFWTPTVTYKWGEILTPMEELLEWNGRNVPASHGSRWETWDSILSDVEEKFDVKFKFTSSDNILDKDWECDAEELSPHLKLVIEYFVADTKKLLKKQFDADWKKYKPTHRIARYEDGEYKSSEMLYTEDNIKFYTLWALLTGSDEIGVYEYDDDHNLQWNDEIMERNSYRISAIC